MNWIPLIFALIALAPVAADASTANGDDRWVIVLDDPRAERMRGWQSTGYGGSRDYRADPRLRRVVSRFAEDHPALQPVEHWPIVSIGALCLVVEIDGGIESQRGAIEADPRVRWIQPLNEFKASSVTSSGDPYRNLQPSFDSMNLSSIAGLSGRGVTLGVVDSAIETDHPDLRHAVKRQQGFVRRDIDNVPERHGTGIAGVIFAARDNGVGIAGVAPGAELHAFRACWEINEGDTRCDSLTLSLALEAAASADLRILNLSLTGPSDRLLDTLLKRLTLAGTVVVVAFDETRGPGERFPSPGNGIIFVHDGSAPHSDVVAAPGLDVLTAQPGHGYDFMSGHSIAAAHVSGLLALIFEADPDVGVERLAAALEASVRRVNSVASVDACRVLDRLDVRSCP